MKWPALLAIIERVARKWMIPAGAALVAIAALIVFARRSPTIPVKPAAGDSGAPPAASETLLSGPVQPRKTMSIPAPDQGVLETWFVEPGQQVIQDQLLGRVRVAKLEAAQQQAQSDLDQTQARAANLDSAQMAAKLELSRAEAEQSRARA